MNTSIETDRIQATAMLSYCKPNDAIFTFLADLYINDGNETVRSTAIDGLLYCKVYIKNPYDIKEIMNSVDLGRLLMLDDIQDRRKMIEILFWE